MNLVISDSNNVFRKEKVIKSTFPDGQPHIKIELKQGDAPRYIQCSLRNPSELFDLVLLMNIVERNFDLKYFWIEIYWLFGARMDRAIDNQQPETFKCVLNLLQKYSNKIYLLDIHNCNSVCEFFNWGFMREKLDMLLGAIEQTFNDFGDCDIYFPDAGAEKRYAFLSNDHNILVGQKKRDSQTGKLSGFELKSGKKKSRNVLILDDICDGAGTFLGQYPILKNLGYQKIGLYTTHGLYTKGLDILSVFDTVYSTNSFQFGQGEDNDSLKLNIYKYGKLIGNKNIS